MGPATSFFNVLNTASAPKTDDLLLSPNSNKISIATEQLSEKSFPKFITLNADTVDSGKTEIKFKKRMSERL
mgnify:CR=1 FL=1